MAGEKFLKHQNGELTEVRATEVGGSGNEERVVSTNANGQLDPSLMPTGVGPDVENLEAFEALLAGDFVNIFDDSGTVKVRKATASDPTRKAHGFVLDAVSAASNVNVFFEGRNPAANGTFGGGLDIFLSTTAGEIENSPPSAGGTISQKLGIAISSSVVNVEIAKPITQVT